MSYILEAKAKLHNLRYKFRCLKNAPHLRNGVQPKPSVSLLGFFATKAPTPSGVGAFVSEDGFERWLLATVLWTVATTVASPQRSESVLPHHKKPTPFGVGFLYSWIVTGQLLALFGSKLLPNHFGSLFQHHFRLIPQDGFQKRILRQTAVGH